MRNQNKPDKPETNDRSVLRAKVRAAYIKGPDLSVVAAANGVPYSTAVSWKTADKKAGNDWDVARRARQVSGAGAQELFSHILEEVGTQFINTLDLVKRSPDLSVTARSEILIGMVDGLSKAAKLAGLVNPQVNELSIGMKVIRLFHDHVAEHKPEMRLQLVDLIAEFGQDLPRLLGVS